MKTCHCLILFLLAAAPAVLAGPFTVRPIPAGIDTPAMAPIAADFLGNGRLQWYLGGNVISRFPEGGNITLPAITLPGTPGATAVPLTAVASDVNRDGNMDIVRINEWNGNLYKYTLQVFLNNGAGSFTLGYRVDWTDNPSFNEISHYLTLVAEDLDKNGTPDLAILETYTAVNTAPDPIRYEGKLYVRWNDNNGNFDTTTMLQSNGLPYDCRISTADYDRDGDMDLHCSRYTTFGPKKPLDPADEFNRSLLFTNDGTGAFAVGSNFPSLMPRQLMDINNDGWVDLVDPQRRALNDGTGTFGAAADTGTNGAAWQGGAIFADHIGDPRPEMVVMDGLNLKSTAFNSNSQMPPGFSMIATLPANVNGLGAADSDGDGDTDFFVSMSNGTFAFVENLELHTVPGATLAGSSTLNGITGLGSADFDLDGRDEVVATGNERLWFVYTQATGLPGTPVFKLTQSESPHSTATADFDADGRPDVAYTLPLAGAVRVARNNGNVPFSWTDSAIATGQTNATLLATGSAGKPNGRPDLFACSNGKIRGHGQSGSGTWSSFDIVTLTTPGAQALAVGQHHTPAPGDEVAYIGSTGSSLRVGGAQLSFGWGTLGGAGQTEAVTGYQDRKLVWADTTGDAIKEVVYINGDGGLSSWNPTTLAVTVLGTAPSAIRDIVDVDWDRDGRTDILAATATGLTVYHYQRARQAWLRSEIHTVAGGYNFVTALDLNRDGLPDAAAYNYGRLDYIHNAPNYLRADLSSLSATANLIAGTTTDPIILPMTSGGRAVESGGLADVNAAVNQLELKFQEAVSGPGGTWTPGAALSNFALSSMVNHVSLVANGSTLSSRAAADLSAGTLFLRHQSGSPTAPLAPGAVIEHRVRFNIAAAAHQHSAPRFFVTVHRITADALNGGTLSAGSGKPTLLAGNLPVLVSILPPLTPLQQWRVTHFGAPDATGTAGNDFDFDGDGVPNLVEYFLGTHPKAAENALNASLGLTLLKGADAESPVSLRVFGSTTALADPKVRVTLQFATSNLNSWNLYATRTGGGSWTGVTLPTVGTPSGGRSNIFFTTNIRPKFTPKYFVRLKVEELP